MEYPPLIRIQGVHRNSSLYHMNDGYFYCRCSQTESAVYFRCSKSGSGCRSTAVLSLGQFQSSVHDHPPNPLHVPLMLERQRLVNEATNLQYVNFAQIFSSTRNLFPEVLTPHSLQPAMTRMRSLALPDEPLTLRGLDAVLSNEAYKCLSATSNLEDTMYAGSDISEDGCCVILLVSRKGKEFMKLSIVLFTFTTLFQIPGHAQQNVVHVIYTVWDGTIIILAWLLIERLTYESCIAAFSLLKSVLQERNFKMIVCQYGSTEANAYRMVFSPVHVTCCLQYFVESVGNLYRSENFPHQIQLINIACLLSGLTLLPSDFTNYGFHYIQQEIGRLDGFAEQANVLLEFVQSRRMCVINDFSMCGDYYRTSDVNGEVKRRVLRMINTHRNSIYSFIRAIASVLDESQKDILDLECGKKIHHRRAVSISDDHEIHVLSADLLQPFGSPMSAVVNLLNAISLKIKHLVLHAIGTPQAGIQN